jgi:phosphinothricin acetyltransferase
MGLSPDFEIRPAREADLPGIHRIYNDAILTTTATWDETPWPFSRRELWWNEHVTDPTTPVFVAIRGGEVVGFSYLSWYRQKSGYRFTREDTIYIDPAVHRMGAGRALLAPVVAAAREHGIRSVLAIIEASNVASIELHRGFGFVPAGTLHPVGFKFGRWLDSTTMELLLAGPG